MKKLMIFCAACLMSISAIAQVQLLEEDFNAVRFEQGEDTDWYMLAGNPEVTFNSDSNPVIAGKTYDLSNGDVDTYFCIAPPDLWETIREGLSIGEYGTVCLPRKVIDMKGAKFFEVVEFMNKAKLKEVTTLKAGVGYVFQATANQIQVKYTGEPVDKPVEVDLGLQGTFTAIQDGEAGAPGNVLEGNYIVYNNKFCKCLDRCFLNPYRAYLLNVKFHSEGSDDLPDMEVSDEPISSANDLKWHTASDVLKLLRDGVIYIIRESKIYNLKGIQLNK